MRTDRHRGLHSGGGGGAVGIPYLLTPPGKDLVP